MRLIGAHVIGEQAIELINIALMAMQTNATFQAFIKACFNFPSLALTAGQNWTLIRFNAHKNQLACDGRGCDQLTEPSRYRS
jgi:pyridine nucleotide-disulfide oxidoreductase